MPLLINGKQYQKQDITEIFEIDPNLKKKSIDFKNKNIKVVDKNYALYVEQAEFSVVGRDHGLKVIGSDSATTCCILFLEHQKTKTVAVAHIDNGLNEEKFLNNIIQRIFQVSGQVSGKLSCKLIGCYLDEKNISNVVLHKTLEFLNNSKCVINLELFCVLEVNTEKVLKQFNNKIPNINKPIIYGAIYDFDLDDYFPALFKNKEPEILVRKARLIVNQNQLIELYDPIERCIKINEFNYPKITTNLSLYSDQEILFMFSTSPFSEVDNFCSNLRILYDFLYENKKKKQLETKFKLIDGVWIAV